MRPMPQQAALRIVAKLAAVLVVVAVKLASADAWADEPYLQNDAEFNAPKGGGGGKLGEAKMSVANDAASKVLRRRMEEERPQDLALLSKVESAEIIVVQGSYDRVEDVLGAVGVPHLLVGPEQLDGIELNAKQLVMVNCPGNLTPAGIEKLRKFVKAGGFLYTTDWALLNVVERAFPGTIRYNQKPTANDVVEIQVKQKDNVFLQHLQLSKDNPKWWLEGSSYPIEVVDPKLVEVLISSGEMQTKYGAAPIAVTFPYGEGRVLHIASHFYLQQNELRTVAEKKGGGEYLAEDSNLSPEAAKALSKDESIKNVDAGDLQSSYASQQFTTNLIVERKRDQGRIDGIYSNKLSAEAEAAPEGSNSRKKLKKGEKVKVVERKAGKVKVQTMSGDEYMFDDAMVE